MQPKFGMRVLVVVCLLATAAIAQRNLSVGTPVSENFNSLGTATLNVTDNTTITGFYTRRSNGNANPNSVTASTGSSGTSALYHWGVAGTNANTDRAFGAIPTSTIFFGIGDASWGLRLVNSGAVPISSISVGFTGEYWRNATEDNSITFSYNIVGPAGDITDLTTGTYTAVPALTYNPASRTGTGALDGNAAANRTVFAPTSIVLSTPLLPGGEIMLRWTDEGISVFTGDDGLAIDDVAVAVVGVTAADATIAGRVTDSFGRAISSAQVRVQDIAGTSKVFYTNTFGYYSVPGLDVGQTYVLSVSARRYTFANPSMVISLTDSVAGANFVASR